MAVYVGIDLTSSERKPTAFAAIDDSLQIIALEKISTDIEIVFRINDLSPRITGIDSPLSLPLDWHCLEAEHQCQPASPLKGRECERQLAREGIPSYIVTTRCIIKQMVYRGIALKSNLEKDKHTVIEVYPYGSKIAFWGRAIPKKNTKAGLNFLIEKLGSIWPGLRMRQEKLDHDLCDALIAGLTAVLYARGQTRAVGNEKEGLVFLPDTTSWQQLASKADDYVVRRP